MNAQRNGLDGMLLTRLHTSMVYATVAASVVCFLLLRSRAVLLLLLVELVQVGIGLAQYQLGVPIWLVALHLLGASLAIAATTNLLLSVSRARRPSSPALSRWLSDPLTPPAGHRLGHGPRSSKHCVDRGRDEE